MILALVLMPLLEAPVEVFFLCGCETCSHCHILLNFFFVCKLKTLSPILVLHCEGGVTRCSVVMLDRIVFASDSL